MTALTLLLRYWRESVIILALLALAGALHARDVSNRELGAARERNRVADSVIVANNSKIAHVDTVYRVDTMRLRVAVTHTTTLRDTLFQNIHDTTVVLRYIAAADSTIQACTEALHTCEQTKALLTEQRDAWKAKALAVPVLSPSHHSLVSNLLWGVVGASVGYYAGHRR